MKRQLIFNFTDSEYVIMENGEPCFSISKTDLIFKSSDFYNNIYKDKSANIQLINGNENAKDSKFNYIFMWLSKIIEDIRVKLNEPDDDISEDANEEEEQRPIKKVGLFLLAACAGEGNDVDGEIQPEEEIVSPYPEAEFAIRISGDSMEPTIHDQETVFVVKAEELNDGDIGIFVVNGVTMCKRYIDDGTSVWLKPDNKEHIKIQITDAIEDYRLQFKVLGYS